VGRASFEIANAIRSAEPPCVLRDKLKVFLEGFRGGDKVVKEEDIRLFVDGMKEQADKR